MKVIVVEDEIRLRDQMVAYLTLSGLDVTGVGSAAELYRCLVAERFSVIILDIGLPDEDGLSVARHVRAQGDVGIIMVTARGATPERVRGFEAGADIYMTKPVEFSELLAAVGNLARRVKSSTLAQSAPPPPQQDQWTFDQTAFSLRPPKGPAISLTAKEMALITKFQQCQGKVVRRSDLLLALGYPPHDIDNRSLDAAIRRLRLKVTEQAGVFLPIQTIHAIGYLFSGKIVDRGR